MDLDLRRIKEKGFLPWLEEVKKTLSDTFWNVELVQNLETSSVNSPYLCVFWAASCREGSDSLFNKGSKFSNILVANLLQTAPVFLLYIRGTGSAGQGKGPPGPRAAGCAGSIIPAGTTITETGRQGQGEPYEPEHACSRRG